MGIPFRQPLPFPQPRSLRRAPQSFDYQAHICLPHGQGVTGVAFGLYNGHGYALTMDTAASCLYFMEIQEGMLLDRGMRRLPVKPGQTCPVRVTYGEGILRLWLNENPLDTEPWPKFEFALDFPGGEIGFFGNGELADESLLAWQPEPVHGETFQNPFPTTPIPVRTLSCTRAATGRRWTAPAIRTVFSAWPGPRIWCIGATIRWR